MGILPGGKPIPIDPHGWRRLVPEERDPRIGWAFRGVAAMLRDTGSREVVERASQEIMRRTLAQLEERR